MGESMGSYIKSGEYIKNGDYLASPNGVYFVVLHSNGILSFYVGNMEGEAYYSIGEKVDNANAYMGLDNGLVVIYSDEPDIGQIIWSSKRTGYVGNYVLSLKNNGSLVVYEEESKEEILWQSYVSNSVNEILNIIDINYDIEKAIIDHEELIEIANSEQVNNTKFYQKCTMEYEENIDEKFCWECFEKFVVNKEELYCTYPKISGGKLIVEDDELIPFTTIDTVAKTNLYKKEIEIRVKPNTHTVETVKVSNIVYHIPFKLTSIVRLEKGQIIDNYIIRGLYTFNKINRVFTEVKEYNLLNFSEKEQRINEGNCNK